MSQDIIMEGSAQELAAQIVKLQGKFRATLSATDQFRPPPPATANGNGKEDAWTKDFRQWAASHRPSKGGVDTSRDLIYADRLE
jgi:hypothetical protein